MINSLDCIPKFLLSFQEKHHLKYYSQGAANMHLYHKNGINLLFFLHLITYRISFCYYDLSWFAIVNICFVEVLLRTKNKKLLS